MERDGVKNVVFAGADEIAYITLQELRMNLVGVVDLKNRGHFFFQQKWARSVTSMFLITIALLLRFS